MFRGEFYVANKFVPYLTKKNSEGLSKREITLCNKFKKSDRFKGCHAFDNDEGVFSHWCFISDKVQECSIITMYQ